MEPDLSSFWEAVAENALRAEFGPMHMIDSMSCSARKSSAAVAIRCFADPIDVDPARTPHETQTQSHFYITNKSINTSLKSASPTPAERRNLACGHKLIGV
jgi:hypothetical protein